MSKVFSMKDFIIKNKNLFENVAKQRERIKPSDDVQYTILNYETIISNMCEFVEGYMEYVKSGKTTYAGKVISTTHTFYDNMFSNDKKYRKTISLYDMKDINESFLVETKRLQSLLEDYSEYEDITMEGKALLKMTDNQYRKLSKVYRDDMQIYLWLITYKNSDSSFNISDKLYEDFMDKTTPVMHKKSK